MSNSLPNNNSVVKKKFKIDIKSQFHKNVCCPNNAFFFEGGGSKGIYAIGVIKYLFGKNPYFDIGKVGIFGGTSVGSYLATAMSLGCGLDDIIEISKNIDLTKLFDNKYLFMITFYRLCSDGYLYHDSGREEIVMVVLNQRLKQIQTDLGLDIAANNLTFGHLRQLVEKMPGVYKHLLINSVDISTNSQIFFTTLNNESDNIKLFDVLLASSAIPYVFKPILLNRYSDGTYGYTKTIDCTQDFFVDGGVSTNNPLDFFLLNKEKFKEYNLWLLKFTSYPCYVQITSLSSLLKQLVQYLLIGKNSIATSLIEDQYNISVINLYSDAGTFDIYTQEQIQTSIEEIYQECLDGKLYFGN